jgi:hypothetical protein
VRASSTVGVLSEILARGEVTPETVDLYLDTLRTHGACGSRLPPEICCAATSAPGNEAVAGANLANTWCNTARTPADLPEAAAQSIEERSRGPAEGTEDRTLFVRMPGSGPDASPRTPHIRVTGDPLPGRLTRSRARGGAR